MGKKSASSGGQKAKEPPAAVPALPGGPKALAPNPAPLSRGHGRHPHIEFKFFEELKHRNVVRVAVLYLLACWLILDPVHVVFHMLEVPAWANRLVVILMAVGFPAVLLFAWAFEVTPEGLKPTVEVDPRKSIRSLTGHRLDRAIIAVLVLALGYFVADKFWLAKREPVPESVATAHALAPSAPAAIAAPEKSIAVLPFVDMSEKKDQEYFSDGLTEELIDRLSHSPDLKVIARTSSFYFKGKQVTIAEIANTLHVGNLLEGSVRRSGSDLRVTAQLIRASDGAHIWSHSFDRKVQDVFKIQAELSETVTRAMKAALDSGGRDAEAVESTPPAYSLRLEADFVGRRASKADTQKAIALYRKALMLDPNYARAWANLGFAYLNLMAYGMTGSESIAGATAQARDALNHALRLDPNLASAHALKGSIAQEFEWNWAEAEAEFRKAYELDPGRGANADYRVAFSDYMHGRLEESIEGFRRTLSRDPLSTGTLWALGWAYLGADRYEEAAATFQRISELVPSFASAKALQGASLLFGGRKQNALEAVEQEPDEAWKISISPIVYWDLGRKRDSNAALTQLEEKFAESSAYNIAEMHAYRKEVDPAFKWLERAYRQRDPGMQMIKADPMLRNLHTDPRFQTMLAKMKLDGDPPAPHNQPHG